MSPNDRPEFDPDDTPPGGNVVPLSPGLAALIARRDALATQRAEYMAHGGHDSGSFRELLFVEDLIATTWGAVWAERAHEWALRDAALIHSEATPNVACPTCQLQQAAWGRDAA